MQTKLAGAALGAALSISALGGAAHAADIVNISATGGQTTYAFGAGTYLIEWIGTADGGLYNGWNGACPNGDCASGWRENFTLISDFVSPHPDVEAFGVPTTYSSALAALLAYQTQSSFNHAGLVWNGSIYQVDSTETINNPWIVTVDAPVTVKFGAGDGSPADNYGGVSLRITNAVPEPQTWAFMILGFGAAGLAIRARRRVVAA